MATSGFRTVERFLLTRAKKPYVNLDKKWVTATDHYAGRHPDYQSRRDMKIVGKCLAVLHQSLFHVQKKREHQQSLDRFRQAMINENSVENMLRELRGKKKTENLMNIRRRMKRSLFFYRKVESLIRDLPLSHGTFSAKNLVRISGSWYLYGCHNPKLAPLHHDTYHLIREIYQNSGWNIESVQSFFDGYRREREPAMQEWIYLLSMLIFPSDIWDALREEENRKIDLVPVMEKQAYWDQLTVWVAEQMDQITKKERVSR